MTAKQTAQAKSSKREAIEIAEFHAEGAPSWARAQADCEVESIRARSVESFLGFNACASPKESTERY